MNIKKTILASFLVLSALAVGSASAGGPTDNKQIETGLTPPCAVLTTEIVRPVRLSLKPDPNDMSRSLYFSDNIRVSGGISNCSKSLQAYYVTVVEVDRGVRDSLGQEACLLWENGAGDFILKSGARTGWTVQAPIIYGGLFTTDGCTGTHRLVVSVYDRYNGALLVSVPVTYTVV